MKRWLTDERQGEDRSVVAVADDLGQSQRFFVDDRWITLVFVTGWERVNNRRRSGRTRALRFLAGRLAPHR
ncbi:hypothetical protein RB11601 [Rhodopirellula baltica SH 1]|uniref:Uncharacterized protein n=1 Tax=Rhodopirellula baltica (strain DSM 10527 / NCIMB 13988 / SH1) TaxID=243090 RepID=Q7UE40_RHOBA|nr:hypothetical protein RB11601 [Rhodopirellula baltica SH 1]